MLSACNHGPYTNFFYWIEKLPKKSPIVFSHMCLFQKIYSNSHNATVFHKLVAWVQIFVSCFWRKWSQTPIQLSNTQRNARIHPRWLFGTFYKCTKSSELEGKSCCRDHSLRLPTCCPSDFSRFFSLDQAVFQRSLTNIDHSSSEEMNYQKILHMRDFPPSTKYNSIVLLYLIVPPPHCLCLF